MRSTPQVVDDPLEDIPDDEEEHRGHPVVQRHLALLVPELEQLVEPNPCGLSFRFPACAGVILAAGTDEDAPSWSRRSANLLDLV